MVMEVLGFDEIVLLRYQESLLSLLLRPMTHHGWTIMLFAMKFYSANHSFPLSQLHHTFFGDPGKVFSGLAVFFALH